MREGFRVYKVWILCIRLDIKYAFKRYGVQRVNADSDKQGDVPEKLTRGRKRKTANCWHYEASVYKDSMNASTFRT